MSFLCATLGSGIRLGADRDEDGHLNGDDCAAADATVFAPPREVTGLAVAALTPTPVTWDDEASQIGAGVRYDVAGGLLSGLRAAGLPGATTCLAGGVQGAAYADGRGDPPSGDGYFYLARAEDSCGTGTFGPGMGSIDSLTCVP